MNNYSRPKNFNPAFFPINIYKKPINNNLFREVFPVLQRGSNGVEVADLQKKLIELKYLKGTPDSYFGINTEKAVLNFQKDANLIMDGIVGEDTWSLLNVAEDEPLPVNEPTIKEGDTNLFVTNLQLKLKTLGYYDNAPTGFFDQNTEKAVKEFQEKNNLKSDGIVGQHTWRLIKNEYFNKQNPIPVLISPMLEGSSGDEVKILQENLQKINYYQGEITGIYDVKTGNSVEKFQKDNNLIPTGIVNQLTWETIEEKLNKSVRTNLLVNELRQKPVLSRETIKSGSTGPDVRDLQFYLKELSYYNGTIDGSFGAGTNSAVRSFQSNNNLLVDGVVGRNTWSALVNLYSPLVICGRAKDYIGVVIDAGHGGTDPGAVSQEISEKDYNLMISLYIANRLEQLGIPFTLTRTSDETLPNNERIKRIKESFGDIPNVIVLSNHINAGGAEGAEVIYALRNKPDLARNILTELGNAGQKTRTYYQRTLPSDPTKDFYYLMRDTNNLETLIVEYGFIDNPNDLIKLELNWEKYAEAVVKAITEFMGHTYNNPIIDKTRYTVKKGDTLYSIARNHNMTVDALKELNNLTNNNLEVGQILLLKEEVILPPQEEVIYYTVKPGDTLWSIATKHNMSVEELKRLNNLISNNLSINQKLLVSQNNEKILEEIESTYVVKKGDTLWSISNQYGITVDTLRRLNNLTTNDLFIGQILTIPNNIGEPSIPIEEIYYIVRPGDSLWSIAKKEFTTVEEIKKLNNLTSNTISIGQKLLIRKTIEDLFPEESNIIYTVIPGDTLWSIAKKYNTTVEKIKNINNFVNNTISVGEELLIPKF